jgi:O-antigen ligase
VSWLPKSPIPFLNATNVIIGVSLGSVLFVRASARFEQVRLPRVWTALLVLMGVFLFAFLRGWVMPPPGFDYPVSFRAKQLWVALAGILAFPPFFQFLDRRPSVRAALVVFSVALALGAAGCVWESRGARVGYRVLGGIGDVNRLGAFFAVGLCLLLPVVLRKGALRGGWRFLTALGTAVSLLGLVLPNSRGALIAFASGGTIYFLFMRPKALIPFVAALTLGWFALPTVVKERLTTTYAGVVESGAEYDVVNKESGRRLEIWKATVGVIAENPIIGVGYANLPIRLNEELDWYRNSHNAYLQIWGETGLAGLFLFVGLLAWLARTGWLLSRRRNDPLACAVGEGMFAMALCLAIANLFGDRFLHFSLEGLFVFAAAVGSRLLAGPVANGGPE